jgi:hypothetical protein
MPVSRFVAEDGTTPPRLSGSDSCVPDGTTPTDPVPGPPTVISTSPANNTPAIATADVAATFSEDMMASSIISPATTFKLVKPNANGTTTKVTAQISYPDPNSPPIRRSSTPLATSARGGPTRPR